MSLKKAVTAPESWFSRVAWTAAWLAGVFYLLNVALFLGLYGDFTMPRHRGLKLHGTHPRRDRGAEQGDPGAEGRAELLFSSSRGNCRVAPRVRITARSTKFSSSRMFPGQCHAESFFSGAAGMESICFSIRRAYFWVK